MLVIGQFVISIALIAGTLVVSRQIEFIRDKRVGFDKEQVVVVPLAKRSEGEPKRIVYTYQIDYDFFRTLGIELAAGRFLAPEFPSDSAQAFVLNEAAVVGNEQMAA